MNATDRTSMDDTCGGSNAQSLHIRSLQDYFFAQTSHFQQRGTAVTAVAAAIYDPILGQWSRHIFTSKSTGANSDLYEDMIGRDLDLMGWAMRSIVSYLMVLGIGIWIGSVFLPWCDNMLGLIVAKLYQ